MTSHITFKLAGVAVFAIAPAFLFAQNAQQNQAAQPEANGFDVRWQERESLFLGPIQETYIPESGFSVSATWVGEQWSNISGGMDRGTKWNSLLALQAELDLEKATGVKNSGGFGISAFWNTDSGKKKSYFDSLYSSPTNLGASDMTRVFEIYYGNSIDTDFGAFTFRVGQLAADEDFMGLDYADVFLNSNFGAMPAVAGASLYNGRTAFSQYALATLGVTIAYSHKNFDATFGLYNGDAGFDTSSNHGFDYKLNGVAFWYQFGYNYELGGLAGRVQFGGNYHSGRFEDFDGGTSRNFYSFYFGLQQEVLKNDAGDAILGVYARLAYAPDEKISENQFYMEGGFNWFAPILGRDDDIFAFGASCMYMSSDARTADSELTRYQTVLETTYKIQFTPALSLQPSMQVFFNPYTDNGRRETCFVAGARLEIIF